MNRSGVVGRMLLIHQDVLLGAIPAPGPVFVCPADAEGKIQVRIGQHQLQREFEQPPAREPVVVVAEAVDAVFPRELDLPMPDFLTRRS